MTEESELKEFDWNAQQIDSLRKEVHAKFLEYSQLQLNLDQLVKRQTEIFKKYIIKPILEDKK